MPSEDLQVLCFPSALFSSVTFRLDLAWKKYFRVLKPLQWTCNMNNIIGIWASHNFLHRKEIYLFLGDRHPLWQQATPLVLPVEADEPLDWWQGCRSLPHYPPVRHPSLVESYDLSTDLRRDGLPHTTEISNLWSLLSQMTTIQRIGCCS